MRMPIAMPKTIATRMPIATPKTIPMRTHTTMPRITAMRTPMSRIPLMRMHTVTRHMELFTTIVLTTTHISTLTGSTPQFTAMPSMQLTLLSMPKNSIR